MDSPMNPEGRMKIELLKKKVHRNPLLAKQKAIIIRGDQPRMKDFGWNVNEWRKLVSNPCNILDGKTADYVDAYREKLAEVAGPVTGGTSWVITTDGDWIGCGWHQSHLADRHLILRSMEMACMQSGIPVGHIFNEMPANWR